MGDRAGLRYDLIHADSEQPTVAVEDRRTERTASVFDIAAREGDREVDLAVVIRVDPAWIDRIAQPDRQGQVDLVVHGHQFAISAFQGGIGLTRQRLRTGPRRRRRH